MSINRKAQKPILIEKILWNAMCQVNRDRDQEWIDYMSVEKDIAHGRTRKKRMNQRLIDGRAVKPCGKECHEWGLYIIKTDNHQSMQNSKELVNDKEFLLKAMKVTPSPMECRHFFYEYINSYLKKDAKFRLELLKSLFKNERILGQTDIEWFVENYHYEKEYEMIKNDEDFKSYLILAFEPKFVIPDNLKTWDNIDEKNSKRRYVEGLTRMHNEAQIRFNNLMKCFDNKVEQEKEKDEIDEFYNTEFKIDFKF